MGSEKMRAALTTKLGRDPTADELKVYVAKKKAAKAAKAAGGGDAKKQAVVEVPVVKAKKEKKKKRKLETTEAKPEEKKQKKEAVSDSAKVAAWRAEHKVDMESVDGKDWTPALTWKEARACVGDKYTDACESRGWAMPTPIQAACWPVMAAKRDTVAIAETGSGKTLAFSLPALRSLEQNKKTNKQYAPQILVLAPTRELAQQSYEVLTEFTKAASTDATSTAAVAYGGVPKPPQRTAMKNCTILVATPGRLQDFFEEGSVHLDEVRWLVLDEADRMLDMGFVHAVKAIARACDHDDRQVAMFSATWPQEVKQIAEEFLADDFVKINVGTKPNGGCDDPIANKRVAQTVHVVEERARDAKLLEVLKKKRQKPTDKVIVFGLYKKECARLETFLSRAGHSCVAIHGDMSQQARNAAFDDFRSGTVPLLVATDVAARGLDIPNVELVINFSFPLGIEDYVHRIGRTGRAGKNGVAETFFHGNGHEKALAGALQNVLRTSGADVPAALLAFGSTVKKKEHKLYGSFGPKPGEAPLKKATKIVF